MIKHFCDVCGRELLDDNIGVLDGKFFINSDERHDLCDVCSSQLNSIVFHFLKDKRPDDDICLYCKYDVCDIDEEPCIRCSHRYVSKFKRRNVMENNNEDND